MLIDSLILKLLGNESTVSIKGSGDVAGIGERSHSEEAHNRVAEKSASTLTCTNTSFCRIQSYLATFM